MIAGMVAGCFEHRDEALRLSNSIPNSYVLPERAGW